MHKVSHRTKSRDRCPKCYIRRALCLCDVVPNLDLKTRIIVILHKREARRPTNTGRLLSLALKNSEFRIRGDLDLPLSEEGFLEPGRETLLFFPSDDAVELSSDFVFKIKKPVTLIVPDGNWRQAAKVMKREPLLKKVTRVKLPEKISITHALRKETKVGGLATFEAVARALGYFENEEIQKCLEKFFEIMVERTLWSRARLLRKDCKNPIPEKALEF